MNQGDDTKAGDTVTGQREPMLPCGPLPPDLTAALNLATSVAQAVELILLSARHISNAAATAEAASGAGLFAARELAARGRPVRSAKAVEPGGLRDGMCRGVTLNVEALRREFPHHGVLRSVTNELTAVSDPAARFGHVNAHRAVLALASRMYLAVFSAADPDAYCRGILDPTVRFDLTTITTRFEAVCGELAAAKWPDAGAILVACEVEAVKAAAARDARYEARGMVRLSERRAPSEE